MKKEKEILGAPTPVGGAPLNGKVVRMRISIIRFAIVPAFFAVLAFAGCAKNSNPVYGGNGSKIFDSGTIASGGHFAYVFTSAMVVPYYCRFHGGAGGTGMSGKITVQAGGTPSKDTVGMVGMTFVPAALTVDVGDTVVWLNSSTLEHTVTSDN
jgi:plastocyanin